MVSTLVVKIIDNMLEEEHEQEVEEQRRGEVNIICVYVSDCLLKVSKRHIRTRRLYQAINMATAKKNFWIIYNLGLFLKLILTPLLIFFYPCIPPFPIRNYNCLEHAWNDKTSTYLTFTFFDVKPAKQ